MPPEHLYYKEVNQKDGNYYRRWAAAIGPNMSELIDRVLKSSKHEEQSYNSCAGILHMTKDLPHGKVEQVAGECIDMNSCTYTSFKKLLATFKGQKLPNSDTLPTHENIRGKGYYK